MKTFIHLKQYTCICIGYILCSCCVYAQDGTLNAKPTQQLKTLEALKTTSKNSIKEIKPKIKDLNNDAAKVAMYDYKDVSQKLFSELEKPEVAQVMDDEYTYALKTANEKLVKLSEDSNIGSIEYTEILNAITKDYSTKVNAMDASVKNSFAKIKVKVRAKKAGAPVVGYSVSGDCIFNATSPIYQYKANNLTDDAELLLPVGTFMIYLIKDNAILQQREIDIDYDVHDDIIFQL